MTAVEAEVVGAGVGLLGQLARLTPTYDRPETGAPATVIGKFPAVAPENREVCRQYGIYEREVGFYEQIAEEGRVAHAAPLLLALRARHGHVPAPPRGTSPTRA